MTMNSEPVQQPDDSRQIYQEHIDRLNAVKIENQRIFARNTLIISGGAFTLSVAILKDLFKFPHPWTKWFLILSWGLFGLCAFLQFYADLLSSKAMDEEINNFREYWFGESENHEEPINRHNDRVHLVNEVTPWVICAGFACMIIFCATNFLYPKGNPAMTTGKEKTQERIITQKEPKKGVTVITRPEKPKPSVDKPVPNSEKPRPKSG